MKNLSRSSGPGMKRPRIATVKPVREANVCMVWVLFLLIPLIRCNSGKGSTFCKKNYDPFTRCGDSILLGYSYTPDWALSKYTTQANYNFFVRRSVDGGASWSDARNLSNITDTSINVKEPRIVGTPSSSDPNDPQNPDVVYVAWGSEENVFEHLGIPGAQLDIFLTYTFDFGATYGGVTTLAGGPFEQFESQFRVSPDGLIRTQPEGNLSIERLPFCYPCLLRTCPTRL